MGSWVLPCSSIWQVCLEEVKMPTEGKKGVLCPAARSLNMARILRDVTNPDDLATRPPFSAVSDLLIWETWDLLTIVEEQSGRCPEEWAADSEAGAGKALRAPGFSSFRILASLLFFPRDSEPVLPAWQPRPRGNLEGAQSDSLRSKEPEFLQAKHLQRFLSSLTVWGVTSSRRI